VYGEVIGYRGQHQGGRVSPGELVVLLTQLGFAYQGDGRHDRAIETFDEIRTVAPSDASGSVFLVQAYLVAGRTDEAVALAERARREFPADLRLAELLAEGYRRQGQPARGVGLLEPLLETARTPSLYATLSEMYVAEGRTDAAAGVLERGRAAFPGDRAIALQLAAVLEQSGRDVEAEVGLYHRAQAKRSARVMGNQEQVNALLAENVDLTEDNKRDDHNIAMLKSIAETFGG